MQLPNLSFFVISDTHYYSKRLGVDGAAYALDNQKSQKLLKDAQETIEAAFRQIAKDDRADIVLLSGDVVNNGELWGHEEMIACLHGLREAGKRVFVITATHDYDKGSIYEGDVKRPAPHAEREALWDMYYPFGPQEAIAVHRLSHSYTAQLADGYRLLALNDDRDGMGHSGFSEEMLGWIHEQTELAKQDNQYLIPMTHHPMIAPSPFYAIIGKNDMMYQHERFTELFAQWGIPFCFTGHTHIQDISYKITANGSLFYDISTASLIGYPGTFRFCVADKNNRMLAVQAEKITEPVAFEPIGGTLDSHMEHQFFGMIRDLVAAAASDTVRFAEMARAFSVQPRVSYKFGWILKPIAKCLQKLTIGKVAKWVKAETGMKPADWAHVKNDSVVEFIIQLVMYLFAGDSPFTPDTAQYKITIGLLNVIDSFLNVLGIKIEKLVKGAASVRSLVEPLLYNAGIRDSGAVLPFDANEKDIAALCPHFEETVRPSKKGLPILLCLVCLILVMLPFSPLIALLLLIAYLRRDKP
ncbi:MAG: metallophosphoesterase [Oscillospiraceae bacterium]|nr:metallophosphoesterase [Oscillospiraceae bacterium]